MSEYQWAVGKGKIITGEYDKSKALTAEQVEVELRKALNSLNDEAQIATVGNEFKEVYKITVPKDGEDQDYFICLKGTTPGGRQNLQNEQRIQQKAKYLNYVHDKKMQGSKGACIGVYKHDSDVIFCAWNINKSSAAPDTPISKQIKIATIARALAEGFAQQMSGSGDYVCAFRSEFIYFYLNNSTWIHDAAVSHLNSYNKEAVQGADDAKSPCEAEEVGSNVLLYGVPGSGKSHAIDQLVDGKPYERVVFHPDYTYSDFVGQIMPKLKKGNDSDEKLTYEFIAGPFTKIMKEANKAENKGKMFYLVIEEINRGNAPAIFGDIFQLLDRKENGEGKYHITNFDIAREVYGSEEAEVRIPSNLSILATMNTSDQNVFTLDTAFQRRWNMKHIDNDVNAAKHADVNIEGSSVTWGQFANVINDEILGTNAEMLSSEDKQLGAYFVEKDELSADKFPEKALKYLWDDAFKMERDKIFDPNIKSIGKLITTYTDEKERGKDPIARVMREDVYKRMMDLSAKTAEEAFEDHDEFEAESREDD